MMNCLTKVFESTKTLGSEYHALYQALHIPKGLKNYFSKVSLSVTACKTYHLIKRESVRFIGLRRSI